MEREKNVVGVRLHSDISVGTQGITMSVYIWSFVNCICIYKLLMNRHINSDMLVTIRGPATQILGF